MAWPVFVVYRRIIDRQRDLKISVESLLEFSQVPVDEIIFGFMECVTCSNSMVLFSY